MQILQVFFLQDLQDLALNLASLALKMKLFLQGIILQESCKKKLYDNFLARFDQNLAGNFLANFSCVKCDNHVIRNNKQCT